MWRCNEKVSGGVGMTNAISVKERLKKQAIEDGKTMQDKLDKVCGSYKRYEVNIFDKLISSELG